jgi:hypothetical protein
VEAKPVKFRIHLDDGCFIEVEGDYTVDFDGAHFSGTITHGGTSPHCPTGTANIHFRSQNPNNDGIEILCDCTDLCYANRIEFFSRIQSQQDMVNYLNSISGAFLLKFKENACY